jgi:hypothetical protein
MVLAILLYCSFFFVYNLLFDKLETTLGSRIYYFIYTVLEFSTFTFLILKAEQSYKFQVATKISWILFLLFCVSIMIIKGIERMDTYEIALETVIVLILIIYFFYLRFKQVDEQYLYQNPHFWLMTGMLVYLGFTYFFNILVNHVDNEVIKNYYHYSYIGDIIKNALFAVALIQIPRQNTVEGHTRSFYAPNLDLI